MKKNLLFFFGMAMCVATLPAGAVTINKASSVSTQESSGASAATSLVPTVLGLVSGIQQITAQQRALTAECVPTTNEIDFVNNMVKEWAKTGTMSAEEVEKRLGRDRCSVADGGYRTAVLVAAGTEMNDFCYDYFGSKADKGMIWENYPKVGIATYCEDGTTMCSDKKTVSDIYEIFNLISFSDADYTPNELTTASRLINKIEKCSDAKLNASKRQMWASFLTDTISTLGQPTNTGSIMQQVSSITGGSGGIMGTLSGTLGGLATQVMGN